jgi:hypothetical protein
MQQYEELQYIKYLNNNSNVQFDCYHNIPPKSELFIENITKQISILSNSSSIISNVSRTDADLNRIINENNKQAIFQYREILTKIILEKPNQTTPHLHIIIHGMKNRENKDIEIGTRNNTLASPQITTWFINQIKQNFKEFKIATDEEFIGSQILQHHKDGDEYHKGFGNNLNIFQIELSRTLREEHSQLIINTFVKIAKEFEEKFCTKIIQPCEQPLIQPL